MQKCWFYLDVAPRASDLSSNTYSRTEGVTLDSLPWGAGHQDLITALGCTKGSLVKKTGIVKKQINRNSKNITNWHGEEALLKLTICLAVVLGRKTKLMGSWGQHCMLVGSRFTATPHGVGTQAKSSHRNGQCLGPREANVNDTIRNLYVCPQRIAVMEIIFPL